MKQLMSRRTLIRTLGQGTAALAAAVELSRHTGMAAESARLKGNIRHSVSYWCFQKKFSLDDLAKAARSLGIESIELLGPEQWPTIKKYGLTCAMASGAGMGIGKGFNRLEHHDKLVADFEKLIPQAADAQLPNVICMSGNRNGLDDEQGIENCAIGVKRLMPICEKYKVNLVMELLNSKVNHKDYQCDHTEWGVKLCEKVGSERFKLLYDIYHMQIMEGDIIATIKKSIEHIAHFHTGGVPGRGEIDETQEIYYPAVMRAIVETGYKGFVGQEFVPTRPDQLASLKQSIEICDV